jgi:hypothetical protein
MRLGVLVEAAATDPLAFDCNRLLLAPSALPTPSLRQPCVMGKSRKGGIA